jgi:hypothetical protein
VKGVGSFSSRTGVQAYPRTSRIILCSSHIFKDKNCVQNGTSCAFNHVTEIVNLEYTAEKSMRTTEVEIIFIENVILVLEESCSFQYYISPYAGQELFMCNVNCKT